MTKTMAAMVFGMMVGGLIGAAMFHQPVVADLTSWTGLTVTPAEVGYVFPCKTSPGAILVWDHKLERVLVLDKATVEKALAGNHVYAAW